MLKITSINDFIDFVQIIFESELLPNFNKNKKKVKKIS